METMKKWKVQSTSGGKTFAEVKIQRHIFKGDALSPLLFIIAMLSFNYILRKCTGVIKKITRKDQSQGWHQAVCKIWKRTENPDTINKNIQPGYTSLDKNIRLPSKMKKKILFTIFKLWKSDVWKIRLRDI